MPNFVPRSSPWPTAPPVQLPGSAELFVNPPSAPKVKAKQVVKLSMEEARDQATAGGRKQADNHHAGAALGVSLSANARQIRAHVAQARGQPVNLAEKLADDLVFL